MRSVRFILIPDGTLLNPISYLYSLGAWCACVRSVDPRNSMNMLSFALIQDLPTMHANSHNSIVLHALLFKLYVASGLY